MRRMSDLEQSIDIPYIESTFGSVFRVYIWTFAREGMTLVVGIPGIGCVPASTV
jgi:hypothetical protein